MIFNTHTHLNDRRFNDNYDQVIKDSFSNGVTKMIIVGYDVKSSKKAIEIADKYEGVYASVGIHPVDSKDASNESFVEIEKLITHPKVVGIGECGLDYHWDTDRELQFKAFVKQIDLAKKYNKPLIIHSRDALKETYDILHDNNAGEIGGVMHCYSGSAQMVESFLNMNFYISLGGPVTFKNAKVPKEVAKIVPSDKLLVETDCPYLAPEPFRGKENKPYYVTYILSEIAKLREVNTEELNNDTYSNAMRLFRIGDE
ncbi:TatD family hydrolase [Mycoplasmatota bacterium WC44]